LRRIMDSDLLHSYYAAGVYAECIGDSEAIALCTRFQLTSPHWQAAMHGLCKHRHDAVIGYIRQLIHSRIPEVRATCYNVCIRGGWIDLAEDAKRDLKSSEWVVGWGAGLLSSVAQGYLDWVEKKRR
jgi:hypothetical protein